MLSRLLVAKPSTASTIPPKARSVVTGRPVGAPFARRVEVGGGAHPPNETDMGSERH